MTIGCDMLNRNIVVKPIVDFMFGILGDSDIVFILNLNFQEKKPHLLYIKFQT